MKKGGEPGFRVTIEVINCRILIRSFLFFVPSYRTAIDISLSFYFVANADCCSPFIIHRSSFIVSQC